MLTREAQLVALLHFPTGMGCEVTFSKERHEKLPEQHLRGLAELKAAGMLSVQETKDTITYASLPELGAPIAYYPRMKPEESWDF